MKPLDNETIRRLGLQVGITGGIVIVGLSLISVLGFPTQRLLDLGQLIGFRAIEGGTGVGGIPGGGAAQNADVPATPVEENIDFLLPTSIYAMAGGEATLQYDGLVLSQDSDHFRYGIVCDACGTISPYGRRSWSVDDIPAGTHSIVGSVMSYDFSKTLGTGTSQIRASTPEALAATAPNILIFGDSITRQHWWVNDLARLLNQNNVQNWSMIGRQYDDGTPPFSEPPLEGVRHEAEFGWSFSFFSSFIAADEVQEQSFRRPRSPFVFGDSPAQAQLDVGRYYNEVNAGVPADYVVMQGGINDIWGVNVDDPVALNDRIDIAVSNANKLIEAFKTANPTTAIGVILPAPFTRNGQDFKDAYGADVTWWAARRAQHALVRKMTETLGGREAEGVWLIPLYATFDTIDGYPVDNAGHPNPAGQREIANSVFAWMSWVASQGNAGGTDRP